MLSDIIYEFLNCHIVHTACSFVGADSFVATFMLPLESIFSNSSDIALCVFSFLFPWIHPKCCSIYSFMFRHSCCQAFHGAYIWLHGYIVHPFGIAHFRAIPTTASANFLQFIVTTANETVRETSRDKPASLSSSTCRIYIHGLRFPFELCCPKPAHPPCTPCIRFLSVIFKNVRRRAHHKKGQSPVFLQGSVPFFFYYFFYR